MPENDFKISHISRNCLTYDEENLLGKLEGDIGNQELLSFCRNSNLKNYFCNFLNHWRENVNYFD